MPGHKRIKKKVVFLGESGVGKTSILLRYDGRGFDTKQTSTLGANYIICNIPIGSTTVELQLWDTAGQERFRSLVKNYLRGADYAIIVYDITSRDSFEKLQSWIDFVQRADVDEPIKIVLMGNKTDLESQRAIRPEKIAKLASLIEASYFETSAANNVGIEDAFFQIASKIALQGPGKKPSYLVDSVTLNETGGESKRGGCCG